MSAEPATTRTLRDIARTAVAELAPEELADFDDLVDDYAARPATAKRAARGRSEPTASAAALAITALTAVVTKVTVDVSSDLTKHAAKHTWRRIAGTWARRHRPRPDAPAPELPPQDMARATKVAIEAASTLGATQEQAAAVADAVVRAWASPS